MHPIYSYEAKWIWDTADDPLVIFECPANLPSGLPREISRSQEPFGELRIDGSGELERPIDRREVRLPNEALL